MLNMRNNVYRSIAKCSFLAIMLCFLSGCAHNKDYRFPASAASQMSKNIKCNGSMLMIPMAMPNPQRDRTVAVLETPVEIAAPFDNLPCLTGYQYVIHGYLWAVGTKGHLFAFLLLGSDGSLYYMDTPDAPFEKDGDIWFYKANLSSDWRDAFGSCLKDSTWKSEAGFWKFPNTPSGSYRWRNAEEALPILKRFCNDHPIAVNAKTGKWERIVQPCFTPNVYCEQKLHTMPKFSSEQILLLNLKIKPVMYNGNFSYNNKMLEFPNGNVAKHIMGMREELDKLWKTGKYRIIAYDRRAQEDLKDPERGNPWAPSLREYATDRGIPLVILYGDDKSAPEYPGLPKGIRQYWQCPQCAQAQRK